MTINFATSKFLRMLMIISMVALVSCGDDDEGDTNVTIQNPDEQQREEAQGNFSTQPMIVINNRVENDVEVISKAVVDNNNVVVQVQCQRAARDVPHRQYIHIGIRCPVLTDDRNGDGYIDFAEAQLVAGPALIPLDSNIQSQDENNFPMGESYNYVGRASFGDLSNTLPPGENLTLNGRVVIVYGISPTIVLPDTISIQPGVEPHASMPIACGVMQQQTNTPPGTTTGRTTGGGTTTGGF